MSVLEIINKINFILIHNSPEAGTLNLMVVLEEKLPSQSLGLSTLSYPQ